jgi:hypothetical protein
LVVEDNVLGVLNFVCMGSQNFSKNSDYFLWEKFKDGDKQALSNIY